MRIFAILLLSFPLWLVAICALFYFIPGLYKVVYGIFWGVVGNTEGVKDIFSMSSSLLEQASSYNQVNIETMVLNCVQLMLHSTLEAFFLGCCIFAVKSTHFFLLKTKWKGNKYYYYKLSRPEWLLDVMGVCIGVVVSALFGRVPESLSSFFEGSVSIILLVFGIVRIWTAGNNIKGKYKENRYKEQRSSFLRELLLSIFGDTVNACIAVNLITCIMEAPRLLRADTSVLLVIYWYGWSIALLFLFNLFMDILNKK